MFRTEEGYRVRYFMKDISNYIALSKSILPLVFLVVNIIVFILAKMSLVFGITASVSLLLIYLFFKTIDWLYQYYGSTIDDLERLSLLIYTGSFYVKESVKVAFQDKKERRLTYFPKIYVKNHDSVKVITFYLESTKTERFVKLDSVLEDMYGMEVVNKIISSGKVSYYLDVVDENSRKIFDTKMKYDKYKIPIGSENYNILTHPHGLITGGTGGGKTTFLMYLIRSYMKMSCEVHIVDGKRSKLSFLQSILDTELVGNTPAQALKQLRLAEEEMSRRYDLMQKDKKRFENNQNNDFTSFGLKPYILFVDEYVALRSDFTDKKDEKEYLRRIRQIVLKGRESGVFIILATQRADGEQLETNVRDNLHLRISLGNLSGDGYRMTFWNVDKTFKDRQTGQGYLFIMGQSKVVKEFWAPLFEKSYDFYNDIRSLAGGGRSLPAERGKRLAERVVRRMPTAKLSEEGEDN